MPSDPSVVAVHGSGGPPRRCGCRPRRCSSTTWSQCRSRIAAGQHEVGLPVAAALAGRRRGGAGLERRRAGRRASWTRRSSPGCAPRWSRPGGLRLGAGPAVDAGPGRRADRAAVPRPLHAARHVVPAAPDRVQPAGPRAPGGRARRGRDRGLAGGDLGEGTRLAAATGAWICFEDEAGQSLRPPKARTWARRGRTPVVPVSGNGSGGCRSRAGLPQARRAGAACSTGSASTAGARASAAACPKPTTPT